MNILLAIDSSAHSEAAVAEVMARPWPTTTKFCVLNVVDLFTLPPGRPIKRLAGAELEASQSLVESIAEQMASAGLEVMTAVTKGYPASSIVEYAADWEADFVIVGSRGLSRVRRFLMGSIARAVVRHAPCSVEIVRARSETSKQAGKGLRILLATDGSAFSVAAALSIASRPWPEGSEVKVISVVHYADYAIGECKEMPRDIAGIERREKDSAAARTILVDAGLKATCAVLTGDPKSVILDEAREWGAHMIVVGAQGRRGISRFLLGSVSETVATHAHCSVEVIRQRPLDKNED